MENRRAIGLDVQLMIHQPLAVRWTWWGTCAVIKGTGVWKSLG